MGEPSWLPTVQTGHQVVQRLGRATRADQRQDSQEPPHHRPDGLGRRYPNGAGGHEGLVRAIARPQEHGEDGVEEDTAGSAAERGGSP